MRLFPDIADAASAMKSRAHVTPGDGLKARSQAMFAVNTMPISSVERDELFRRSSPT